MTLVHSPSAHTHRANTAAGSSSSTAKAPAPAKNRAGEGCDAGFDLYRLDCITDALIAGPPLSRAEQHELARIIENLTALMETVQ